MPETSVICQRKIAAEPDAIWRLVGDFWSEWHPAIVTNTKVLLSEGTEVRRFSAADGSDYQEHLTYLSHSDRSFDYVLTSGIEGVEQYTASAKLEADEAGVSILDWSANITAGDGLSRIAEGTRRIFETGFDYLEAGDLPTASTLDDATKRRPIAPVIAREQTDTSPSLSYLSCIKPEADTLVLFLHGIGGNAENWLPQMEALGAGHNLAALDIRGYGDSSLGPAASTVEDHCNDILKVLRQVGANRLILIGLSMGSWIATSFSMRYPKLVRGLVLAGGCTGMSEASPEVRDGFRRNRSQPILAGKTPADIAPDILEAICGPSASLSVRKALSRSMEAISAETYLDALNCFCKPQEVFDFSKIDCPVLMMTGENDRLAPPDEIRQVSRRIHDGMSSPDVRFEILNRAGHVCNLEAPNAFNQMLERFLCRFPDAHISAAKSKKAERREKKQQLILAAALSEFSAKGFDGASMNAIAEKAKVSKPTLYQYFGDKDCIFKAVLEVGRSHIMTPLIETHGSLVDRLWAFSWTYAEFVLRPDMLSLARLILGEATRRPDSAEAYHKAGPEKALQGLMQFVEDCIAEGLIETEDVELTTQDLWSLILSAPRDYHLHHVHAKPDEKMLLRAINHGLSIFLTVYSLNREMDLVELEQKRAEKLRALEAVS